MSKGEGIRFNEGKRRYDLVHPWAHEQMVNVLTKGSLKYAERNWEKGMAWSNVISSLKRHLAAIEAGEDRDLESGELHASHLACNAHFLTAYYKIFPEGDDRPHSYLNEKRIGLDIDDVLAEWVGTFCKLAQIEIPKAWNFGFMRHIGKLIEGGLDYKDVMLNLPVKTKPEDMPKKVACFLAKFSNQPAMVNEFLLTNPVLRILWKK